VPQAHLGLRPESDGWESSAPPEGRISVLASVVIDAHRPTCELLGFAKIPVIYRAQGTGIGSEKRNSPVSGKGVADYAIFMCSSGQRHHAGMRSPRVYRLQGDEIMVNIFAALTEEARPTGRAAAKLDRARAQGGRRTGFRCAKSTRVTALAGSCRHDPCLTPMVL